jgi:protein-L-isoaspartate(D-aspartate) O-methyltransferase
MTTMQAGSAETCSELRNQMVKEQIAGRSIHDARVLCAMSTVPREEFVPLNLRHLAYADQPLPIECEQTISQPYTVAYMCQALRLQGNEHVLEVGTGSGYGAAVLSRLAAKVVTVERIPFLAHSAAERLATLGYDNVEVHTADGTLGWPGSAPYDAIVVTASAAVLPAPYFDQLKEGGRIVIPIGPLGHGQSMCRFTRRGHEAIVEDLGPFSFVPLIGVHGWNQSKSEYIGF